VRTDGVVRLSFPSRRNEVESEPSRAACLPSIHSCSSTTTTTHSERIETSQQHPRLLLPHPPTLLNSFHFLPVFPLFLINSTLTSPSARWTRPCTLSLRLIPLRLAAAASQARATRSSRARRVLFFVPSFFRRETSLSALLLHSRACYVLFLPKKAVDAQQRT
jgi:hypothetical protein